ncbi:cytochrome P450 monooxygenase pc-3 [Cristinia sonorae]|uniref:Cytochrome P450 monooxygenase pc-3 n=1 Tax=Cristinia sonorae TaxID=1940300 RepID=A0A8K0XUB6_9AGAR|nr:cytochrome P450 monooxygenase pc-3 [Cristinia sonorae]
MHVSPGIQLLAKTVCGLLTPSAIIVLLSKVSDKYYDITIPEWMLWTSCILSAPFLATCAVWRIILWERYRAWRLGAQPLPRLKGKWIGDIDFLVSLFKASKHGYFYEPLWNATDTISSTIDTFSLWEHDIITCNPEIIKIVLATDFDNYVKGPVFHYANESVLGSGVFNVDGDLWKFHRGMSRPYFSRERISHLDMFDKHADTAINKMRKRFLEGHAVNFQDLVARFTLDSATEFLFGSCVNSLASELPHSVTETKSSIDASQTNQAEEFAEAWTEAQIVLADRTLLQGVWPFTEILRDRTRQPMKIVNDYVEPILKNVLAKDSQSRNTNVHKSEEDDTLLGHLVKETKDVNILRDETLNIMIAGRDTTAACLTYCIYFLCMYPNACERLRSEILGLLGPESRPTLEDIRELKYLRAFINETLRLFPPVPWNSRSTVKETTWPNPDPNGKPFYIPANANVSWSVFMMHRREEYWGPDVEEFDPDRFLDERLHKYIVPNPFVFLPFNGGPRICLGQQFAYNEISFFLVRLLQQFESMELDAAAQPPSARPPAEWQTSQKLRVRSERIRPKQHLTSYIEGGLWVRMKEAV